MIFASISKYCIWTKSPNTGGPYMDGSCSIDRVDVGNIVKRVKIFSLKNSRSCPDLNPGPPGTKPKCYQLSYPGLDLTNNYILPIRNFNFGGNHYFRSSAYCIFILKFSGQDLAKLTCTWR